VPRGRGWKDVVTADEVKQRARDEGFDLCGIAPAQAFPELGHLAEWLARGYAGEMSYLHRSAGTRADIRRFLPSARSVVVTGTLYNTDPPARPGRPPAPPSRGRADAVRVARYARGDDYHVVIAERLESLAAWMRARAAVPVEAAVFVDKHHVQERAWAARAGVGWIGKNACVISPEVGSWLLLGGIATSLALEPDAPALDQCGTCTLCLDACPTGALVDARELDATRCLSYLTIELEGDVPEPLRPAVGPHLFGCDICQEVCPWNLAAPVSTDPAWQPRTPRDGTAAAELWQRTDQDLHGLVRGSAMRHTSLARLRRNLALVIGNSGEAGLAAVLDRPGRGVKNAAPSASAPVVREAVTWARARLAGRTETTDTTPERE
jgi:epoxyqueuosine reductase